MLKDILRVIRFNVILALYVCLVLSFGALYIAYKANMMCIESKADPVAYSYGRILIIDSCDMYNTKQSQGKPNIF